MADKAKKNFRITDALTKPLEETTEEERETFRKLVLDLGRNKYYPNTKYVDSVGRETTVREELDNTRRAYANSDRPDLHELSKLTDPQLLQRIRERAMRNSEKNPAAPYKWLREADAKSLSARQKAFDQGTGS